MSSAGRGFEMTARDIEALAYGAAFLGSGGGGDPYIGGLILKQEMARKATLAILDPTSLADDARVVCLGAVGAPTILIERLPNIDSFVRAVDHARRRAGDRIDAVMAVEAGGLNALLPLAVALRLGLPAIDADAMGRAFPETQMMTFSIHGLVTSPLYLADDHKQSATLEARDNVQIELFMRPVVDAMGGSAMAVAHPLSGADIKRTCVPNTLSTQLAIGRAVLAARAEKRDPVLALIDHFRARPTEGRAVFNLFSGKIVDIERRTDGAFAWGRIRIADLANENETCEIEFKNENLVARNAARPLAMTPDIITIVEAESASPITTENVRYGQRVRVIGLSAPAVLRSEKAIGIVGPRAFNLDLDYAPIERLNA